MTEWYFDIETEGKDPERDRVLTIQYQAIEDSEVKGPFQVLAEWEWGEKQIVRSIVEKGLLEPTSEFLPVGNHLPFDISCIMQKAKKYGIRKFTVDQMRDYWFRKPIVDIAPVLRLRDRRRNPGSASPEVAAGEDIADVTKLFREGRYTDIIEYVTRKKEETMAMLRDLGALLEGFRPAHQRP